MEHFCMSNLKLVASHYQNKTGTLSPTPQMRYHRLYIPKYLECTSNNKYLRVEAGFKPNPPVPEAMSFPLYHTASQVIFCHLSII
jgi:hypothetical protein